MTIGEQLSQARKRQSLTQQQVADSIHVARQTISNWEVGRSYPDIASLIVLSDLFQLSLDELVKEDKQMVRDLRLKEEERRSARTMYWGSWLVNVVLTAFLISRELNVPAMKQAWAVSMVVIVVMMMNLAVLTGATKRYRKMLPAKAPRPYRELSMNMGAALVFTVIVYTFWGFSWLLAGIVSGMVVVGMYRFISVYLHAHRV
jgi:transcriptional regulator with XRE-family HTH domain